MHRATSKIMLPAYIIEELRRREEVRREDGKRPRPRLELPIPVQPKKSEPPKEPDRGIAIIEVWG